ERKAVLAEREIPTLEHLRHDVRAALHLEIDERWLTILHLVQGRKLLGVRLDIGELPVVPDGTDQERLLVLGRAERELQRGRILASEARHGFLVFMPHALDRGARVVEVILERDQVSGRYVLRPVPRR